MVQAGGAGTVYHSLYVFLIDDHSIAHTLLGPAVFYRAR
jgi:hypothetical protein